MAQRFEEGDLGRSAGKGSGWLWATVLVVLGAGGVAAMIYFRPTAQPETAAHAQPAAAPHVVASNPIEAGRYLVTVGACNDCHTPGFMEKGLAVPESEWLTGVPIGWRGPWGTTYASNLRLSVATYDQDAWVKLMHLRTTRPPMPWTALNKMNETDLAAIYHYIKSLGVKGERMPGPLGPDIEPATPYILMQPIMPRPATQPAQ